MTTETKVYDQYSTILNFKKAITTLNRPAITITWIPRDHERRLKAYEILTALYFNYSRDYRNNPESGDASNNDSIWEMGDPAWFCDKMKDKLLGSTLKISIEQPDELRGLDTLKAQEGADKGEVARLQTLADDIAARQTHLRRWWKENNICLQVDENEEKCSYLGDCAYMIEWDPVEKTPKLKTYDPGFVFPFYGCNEDSIQEGGGLVKDRLVVAWEEDSESWQDSKAAADFIILWQDIYELRVAKDGTKHCWRHSGYYKFNTADKIELENVFDDSLVEGTSEGWKDLGIDFIPIKLIPNRQIQGSEFGVSNMHFHIDLFDGIITSETDLVRNSAYLGGATVGFSGKDTQQVDPVTKALKPISIQPNMAFALGEGGRMDLLDTSRMQDALLATLKYQIDKLIRTSGVTGIGIGQVDAQSLSTLSIIILMQPLLDKIGPRRQQRQAHYSELFWMVQRLYQIFGTPDEKRLFADPLYDIVLEFGNIVPENKAEKIDYYIKLAGLVGDETALEQAKKDGLDIDVAQVMERKAKAKAAAMQGEADLFNERMGLNNQGA